MKIMVDNFWPSCRCIYCGGPSLKMAICAACTVSLPWIEQACSGCARPQNFNGLCRRCLKKPMPFDAAWSAFQLDSPIREAIHIMKYRAGFAQAKLLGQLFAQKIGRRALPLPAVIIPVPLHQGRLRIRGYNQSRELALAIQRSLAIEVAPGLARRIRATPDQIGQSRSQRQKNLRGAFAVDARIKGQHVALLDDVMTTGATLAELATAARRAGAARIEAWAIARVP